MTSPTFRRAWYLSLFAAWWNAWMDFWGDFGDEHDPDVKRDRRAQANDQLDGYLADRVGGNFEGSGTGGQD